MLPQKTECRSDARYLPALCFFAFGAAMRGLQCPAAACFCAAARRGRTRDSGAGRLFVKWERKFCLVRRIETLCRAGGGELAETALNVLAAVFYLAVLLLYSPLLTLIGLANVAACLVIIFLSNTAHDLQDELAAFVALDLSGVNYLSAACMQTLLAIQQKIDERGGRLLLIMQKRSGRRTRNSAQYWIH